MRSIIKSYIQKSNQVLQLQIFGQDFHASNSSLQIIEVLPASVLYLSILD